MSWIVWLGTDKNPKKQKHRAYENESEADLLIHQLKGLFPDLIITKEKVL